MPSFRKSSDKASHAIRAKVSHGTARHGNKDSGTINSLGTERNYTQALKGVQDWLNDNRFGDLKNLDAGRANQYLVERSEIVTQRTIDLDRQALQMHLEEKLERVQSHLPPGRLGIETRAYTPEQVKAIAAAQPERYALATEIAHATGLRAHELFTLRPAKEQPPSSHREWSTRRFRGRTGVRYTIVGKGGLITEKLIPHALAQRLEARRLANPQPARDRGINYHRHYDIGAGKAFSQAFTGSSRQVLGFSSGAHGLRHSYAQERDTELQAQGRTHDEARGLVSQELGHFSPDTTRSYER